MKRRGSIDDEISDETLLAAMAIGDDRAATVFVRRFQRRIFGLVLGIVGDSSVAEDVTQEAFVRIVRHASIFDPRRATASTWVLTIARHLAIDAIRVHRGVPTAPDDRVFLELTGGAEMPDDALDRSEAARRTRRALLELPVEQRRAVVLAAMYGRTAEEVARVEQIPLGTAKSRIRLAMAKLRSSIDATEIL